MKPLASLEERLSQRIRAEEARYAAKTNNTDTLWGHLVRVAGFAERLGRAEGLDPLACRLAGLFHDAGKFVSGVYHVEGQIEEEQSVQILREMVAGSPVDESVVSAVCAAILALYRDTPETTALGRVLFDADNLDKLGPLGVANFFVKTGLRGRGLSLQLLTKLTVELTYARYAEASMTTRAGQALGRERSAQTVAFIQALLSTLREDGVFALDVVQESFDGLTLDVVTPAACFCGAQFERHIWADQGIKCRQINLDFLCPRCDHRFGVRFCRPRLRAAQPPR